MESPSDMTRARMISPGQSDVDTSALSTSVARMSCASVCMARAVCQAATAKQYLEEVRLDGRDSCRQRVRSFNPRMVHSKRNAMRRGAVYKNDPCMSTDTAASTDTL